MRKLENVSAPHPIKLTMILAGEFIITNLGLGQNTILILLEGFGMSNRIMVEYLSQSSDAQVSSDSIIICKKYRGQSYEHGDWTDTHYDSNQNA